MIRLADRTHPDRPALVRNRVVALMVHTHRYAFKGLTRLAQDAGISQSALSRFVRGERRPGFLLVSRVAAALERELGRPIDLRDIVTEEPEFPTKYACAVAGCRGCLPDWAYGEDGIIRPEYTGISPGQWTDCGPILDNLET